MPFRRTSVPPDCFSARPLFRQTAFPPDRFSARPLSLIKTDIAFHTLAW
ncbi:molecular chaperone GroEL [Clostridiales bacterium TF09-2AC]|nr:molecular chaperone GroEL [Clostridiales bacterium TF09-2AC]